MVRVRQLIPATFLSILLSLLVSGCATPPRALERSAGEAESEGPATAVPAPVPKPPRSAELQAAMAALDIEDHEKAFMHFDEMLKSGQEIPADYLYNYGLGLSKAGRYEEAIEQFSIHIDNLAQKGIVSHSVESARFEAEQLLEADSNAQQAAANFITISKEISDNLQTVQQRVATGVATITEPLTGIEMVLVTGGCYLMGDQFGDGEKNERPVHKVCIDDFYLGRHEVTQQQWLQVMGYNPSKYQQGGDYPVDNVSWQESIAFAETLSGRSGNYRLPTEAEWEYAARSGGQKEKFSGSANVDEIAWHIGNSGRKAHPVGQKPANGLGLHDMSGNANEWCLDRYAADYYSESPLRNPAGVTKGRERTRRGGSWGSKKMNTRTSYRVGRDEVNFRNSSTGFRLALPATQQ